MLIAAVLIAAAPAFAGARGSSSAPVAIDPQGSPFDQSIACPSATQCTAVAGGNEVTFDPSSPSAPHPVVIDGASSLDDVACPSTAQCTAVDAAGNEVTFDPLAPGTPTLVDVAGTQLLNGLACPSRSQCTAVTDPAGDEVTFDPVSPRAARRARIGSSGFFGVACPSRSQCTAVGNFDEVTFDPIKPSTRRATSIAPDQLEDVACPARNQCTAVHDQVEVTFDPLFRKARVRTRARIVQGELLSALACPSRSQCTAISSDGEQATTFDPADPAIRTSVDLRGELTGLACPSRSRCVAVDDGGNELTFRPRLPRRGRLSRVAARCIALHAPGSLRGQLVAAYLRAAGLRHSALHLRVTGSVRYGRCGSTMWAEADVEPVPSQRLTTREQVALQDHSATFRKLAAGRWLNLSLGPLCGAGRLPTQMARAWHIVCR